MRSASSSNASSRLMVVRMHAIVHQLMSSSSSVTAWRGGRRDERQILRHRPPRPLAPALGDKSRPFTTLDKLPPSLSLGLPMITSAPNRFYYGYWYRMQQGRDCAPPEGALESTAGNS